MPKNSIQISVKVLDENYLPDRERVVQWLGERYDDAVELARQNRDGTATAVTQRFPCVDIPKAE